MNIYQVLNKITAYIEEHLEEKIEYEEKILSTKEIIAVDSSLSVKFVRADKSTKIVINNNLISEVDTKILLKEIYNSSVDFCKLYSSSMLSSVKKDLEYAFDKISKLI